MKLLFLIVTTGLVFGVIKQTKSVKDLTEIAKVHCKDICAQK